MSNKRVSCEAMTVVGIRCVRTAHKGKGTAPALCPSHNLHLRRGKSLMTYEGRTWTRAAVLLAEQVVAVEASK